MHAFTSHQDLQLNVRSSKGITATMLSNTSFNASDPASIDPPTISTAACYAEVNSVWPDYAVMAISFFEIITTYEFEARIYQRVAQRRKFSVSILELFFWAVKVSLSVLGDSAH